MDVSAAAAATDELSLWICALKGHNCEQALEIVSVCRTCCGGQGVVAANRIGEYSNVLVTLSAAEGDLVLLQQKTSRSLLMKMLSAGGEAPDSDLEVPEGLVDDDPDAPTSLEGIEIVLRVRQVAHRHHSVTATFPR